MAIVTIGFNPAIDRILECPDFHVGGHQQAKQIARLAAGKAANVSRALAQLGVDSIATGFIGADELEFFHEQLLSCGPGRVLCRFVEVGGATRENITILDTKRRLETHLRDRGFSVGRAEAELLEQKLMHELKPDNGGDYAIFAGSLCEGLEGDFFGGLLDKCAGRGAKVAVDSSGQSLKDAAAKKIWLLKPNLLELSELVGRDMGGLGQNVAEIRQAAAGLLQGCEMVLVTRGAEGAVLVTRDGAWSGRVAMKTPQSPVRTVGCGDHLLAGFVSEMAAGRDPQFALAMGLAVATARAMSVRYEEIDGELVKNGLNAAVVEQL